MNISPLRFLAALLISVIGLASISSAQLAFQFNFTDSGSGFNDPTLGDFGVTGSLADPQLTLFKSENGGSTQLQTNDTWDSAALLDTANRVGAFALLAGSLDAGLLVNLSPGAYTVQLSGVSNGTGVGLIEVYDAD